MSDNIDIEPEIERAALPALAILLRRWMPDGIVRDGIYIARHPARPHHPLGTLRVNLTSGEWANLAQGVEGRSAVALVAHLHEISPKEAAARLRALNIEEQQ